MFSSAQIPPPVSLPCRAWSCNLPAGLGLAALLLASVAIRGAETVPPAPAAITGIGEFWSFTGDAARQPQTVNMELVVYYYDSGWNLLYGETAGSPSFLPVRGRALALKSGQKVRLEGTVVPAEGFDGERIKATILAEGLLPEPRRAAGRVGDFAALHARWTELEGYVITQHEPDATHIEAKLLSEGSVIDLTVQINGTDPVPQLAGARVRVLGVYDAVADGSGRSQQIQCWTSERVQVLGWLADDKRFQLAPTPIERLEATADQPTVRLVGEVWAQEPGRTLTLRDDTGQVVIATVQPGNLSAGTRIEVVGRPAREEFGWTLQDPLFRTLQDTRDVRTPGQAPQRLRLTEQVLRLAPEEAAKHQAVSLRGVVTWFDERAAYFFLQDASGGVRVRRDPGPPNGLAPGASIALTGTTARGEFAAEVELGEVAPIGPLGLPPARGITLDQALSGGEEFRRVEMRGYVRRVRPEGRWTRLELTAATGEFAAILPAGDPLDYLQGALVRVLGVCTVKPDGSQAISGIELWVQSLAAVVVDEPPAREPFAGPAKTTAELRRFTTVQNALQRARVSGMLLLHEPDGALYLQDREGGLLVLGPRGALLSPGSWIEVAGVPGRAGNRLTLRDAVWRLAAPSGPAITPRELKGLGLLDPASDLQLVRVPALLRQAVNEGERVRLMLETEGVIFEGRLPAPADWKLPAPGSRLELTGVNLLEFDDYRQPRGFRLELRSPADVVVRATPPWWTVQRTLYAAGMLGAVSFVILIWVVALRRRVRQQTEQIRQQLAKEASMQSEVERAARLESLGVLAGGIAHDFNNLLTAILGNLGLAAMDKRVMAAAGDCISEAERGARRARDITHQLLTFAKGGEPMRMAVMLPEIVTEAANFARHGSNVRLDVSCPPDLPAADVDAGQISRVVHNLVINAIEAMPAGGMVSIALTAVDLKAGAGAALAPGRYVCLAVTDTGQGISPDIISRIYDPYFTSKPKNRNSGLGLATVRSIILKHSGHIEVESKVGVGTTFRLWLPAAREEAPAPAKLRQSVALTPARVLVMDDEAVVRRVAGRMLALAGHEIVFAADGAEAVQAYVAARRSGAPFDFVIFDLTVPGGMGGKEALAELLKVDAGIRAIASSGYSNDPVMANPRTYGFRARLPKPYDIPDLIRAIEEARGP